MFDKNNNGKNVNLQIEKLYQDEGNLLSTSLVKMMNDIHNKKMMEEHNDYQSSIISYHNQKHENEFKKQYNPTIVNLYKNGIIVINNQEYLAKDFFIVFNSQEKNYHLKCINPNFNNEEIEYDRAVRFIDTTVFISLIGDNVIDNHIIINDINILKNAVSNWDGYLHSEVLETDSIIDKKMVKE